MWLSVNIWVQIKLEPGVFQSVDRQTFSDIRAGNADNDSIGISLLLSSVFTSLPSA